MRRRMINPEFFTDPDIVANLDFGGRLFYQGLWCIAEDSGVFDPNPLALKMKIFPGDDLPLDTLKEYYKTLVRLGKVLEFEHQGRTYAWLKNFHKHQKIDRPSPPTLPLPTWVIWHGENEFGKDKHKWHYEISTVPGSVVEQSATIRRTVVEQDTTEVKLSKEKLSKYNTSPYGDGGQAAGEDKGNDDIDHVVPLKPKASRPKTSAEAKQVVMHLKDCLTAHGVDHLPRDWHLKNYAVADRIIRSGVSPGELLACIDWLFADTYWCDKVTDMLVVERQYPKFRLRERGGPVGDTRKGAIAKHEGTVTGNTDEYAQYDAVWTRAPVSPTSGTSA